MRGLSNGFGKASFEGNGQVNVAGTAVGNIYSSLPILFVPKMEEINSTT